MEIRDDATAEEIREFYAADLPRRLRARIDGNLRIDRAIEFMTARVEVDDRILDIGCGIGVATEKLAANAEEGRVWALDISPAHIDYCRRTIERPNLEFFTLNVVEEFTRLDEIVDGDLDVVTMVDVLEHLPQEAASELFANLGGRLSDRGRILLTYPSPTYQRHLYETEGSRLQAIDRIVEIDEILDLAKSAGCELRHFSHVDVWRRDQYIHCELVRTFQQERFDPWGDWSGASAARRAQICTTFLRQKVRGVLRPLRRRQFLVDPLADDTP